MTEEKNTQQNEELSQEKNAEIKDEKKAEAKESKETKKEKKPSKEVEAMKKQVEVMQNLVAETNDKYLRMMAEYENYRKRAAKEKESIYSDAYADVIKELLPVLDNLERAVAFADSGNLSEGVTMTLNMFKKTFETMGVEEIPTENVEFDPNVHNAVMHVEDDSIGENMVVETFSKGYKKGDKIIRYAMVKVAN